MIDDGECCWPGLPPPPRLPNGPRRSLQMDFPFRASTGGLFADGDKLKFCVFACIDCSLLYTVTAIVCRLTKKRKSDFFQASNLYNVYLLIQS